MIYNLSFTTDQFDSLKRILYKTHSNTLPEIELRFGSSSSGKYVAGVDSYTFKILLDKMSEFSINQTHNTDNDPYNQLNDVVRTVDTVESKKNMRKIINQDGRITYEQKDKKNIDISVIKEFNFLQKSFTESTIRFSSAIEQKIDSKLFEDIKDGQRPSRSHSDLKDDLPSRSHSDLKEKSVIRRRNRTSFHFQNFIFDFTETITDNKTPVYEVEAEFSPVLIREIKDNGEQSFPVVIDTIKRICSIFFFTIHSLFSVDYYQYIIKNIYKLYSKIEKAVRPKNIYIEECKSGLINYAVTNKLDGVGYQFFILLDENEILSFYLKNNIEIWKMGEMIWKNFNKEAQQQLSPFLQTIFDVELFKSFTRSRSDRDEQKQIDSSSTSSTTGARLQLHCFDVIHNPYNIQQKPLFERLDIAKQLFTLLNALTPYDQHLKLFSFYIKGFYYSEQIQTDIHNVLSHMNQTYGGDKLTDYNDGIVFQSIGPYHPKNIIYKWKFYSKITIDFAFEFHSSTSSTSTYKCLVITSNKILKPFQDEYNNEIQITVPNDSFYNGIRGDKLDGFVIEVGKENDQLVIHRIRFDKRRENVNFIDVARATWKDIVHELTLPVVIREIDNSRSNVLGKPKIDSRVVDKKITKKTDEETIKKLFPQNDLVDVSKLIVINKPNILGEEGAQMLVNFIYYDCISYGNKQEYFDIRSEISIMDGNAFIGITSIVLSKTFHKVISFTTSKEELEAINNNLQQYKIKNVETKLSTKEDNMLSYSTDVIFIDLMLYPISRDFINKLKTRCSLLVLRVDKNLSEETIENKYDPSFYFISEDIDNYKFIGMFTNPNIIKRHHRFKEKITITRGCMMFRKQYNKVKAEMIKKYSSGKNVVDIGFGKGGDIMKYKNNDVKKLFGIEPNKTYIDEFYKSRSKGIQKWISEHVRILQTEGQDVEGITNLIGDVPIQTINMFFSMSFFYKDENTLDRLVETIATVLQNDGVFVGGYMDGNKIQHVLNIDFGMNRISTPCYDIISRNVNLEKHFGQEIIFNMKDSETANTQIEYLVYLQELERRLIQYDIYLEENIDSIKLIDTTLLNNDEKYLAQFYSFFIFKKGYNLIINVPTISPISINDELLIRLPVKADGDCFIHAILSALSIESINRRELKLSIDTDMNVSRLREHLAANFTLDKYQSLGGGKYCILRLQMSLVQFIDPIAKCYNVESKLTERQLLSIIEKINMDQDIVSYINELTQVLLEFFGESSGEVVRGVHLMNYIVDSNKIKESGVWIEEWMMPYIEDELNINIYVVSNRTKKLHSMTEVVKSNGRLNLLLINNDNIHFEVLARDNNNRFSRSLSTIYTEMEIKSLF